MTKDHKTNFQNEISKEEVNKLDVRSYAGKITVLEDPSDVDLCINYIRRQDIVGFDTESRPSFKKNICYPVSLIQFAIPGEVFLFRINLTGLKPSIIDFFQDENVKKAGVSVHDDIHRLNKLIPFEPRGFIELQDLTSEFGIINNSLRKLTAIVLGFRISKSQQLSNWEAEKLTDSQLQYAATDAWVCLEIFKALKKFVYENVV